MPSESRREAVALVVALVVVEPRTSASPKSTPPPSMSGPWCGMIEHMYTLPLSADPTPEALGDWVEAKMTDTRCQHCLRFEEAILMVLEDGGREFWCGGCHQRRESYSRDSWPGTRHGGRARPLAGPGDASAAPVHPWARDDA